MNPLRVHYDKLLLAAALLLLGAGVGWSHRERAECRQLLAEPAAVNLVSTLPEPEPADAPTVEILPAWAEPVAGEDAAVQVADLFTAPMRRSHRDMARSASSALAGPAEHAVSPELVAVRKEPYRFQLAGYAGRPGAYRVALADATSSETSLVQVGQCVAALGVTLVSFELRQSTVAENEAGPVREAVAVAVLHDEATGTDVVLDNRRPLFTGRLLAALRVLKAGREIWEGGEGESLSVAGATYHVERIRFDPAEVTLVRSAPGR
ncbi:MAG: hypothetical protein QG602_4021, partial [Verrucomicrobiota bacterium]|nr:hypothetical protein [Verrucomicrobiota bacterium]